MGARTIGTDSEIRADTPRREPPPRTSSTAGAVVAVGLTGGGLIGASGAPFGSVAGFVLVSAGGAALVVAARSVVSGVIGTLWGAVGVALGIGVGVRHLTIQGFTWRSAMGMALLLLGGALSWSGIRRLALSLGSTMGRAMVAAGASSVSLLLIWTMTPALLATALPHIPPTAVEPSDVGMAGRRIVYDTADGVGLSAWYIPSEGARAVVLRHGSGSTASDVFAHARVLSENGYSVLVTDARGHGHSEGRPMDFGWYGDLDIAGAITWLIEEGSAKAGSIGVLGISMGGEEAIGAAASDARIGAVVAEGATARTAADKAWFAETYGTRGTIQIALERVQYGLTDLLTEASPPISLSEAARMASPTPILLVTAGSRPDEGHAADHLRRHATNNVLVWTIADASHGQGLDTAPDDWAQAVIGFFYRALPH